MNIINGFQIISTEINEANKIICQTGFNEDGVVIDQVNELVQQQGIVSLPIKPEANTQVAPSAMTLDDGQRKYTIAVQDARGNSVISDLKAGEICLYAAGEDGNSQGNIKLRTDGSINLYTTSDNTNSGNPLTVAFTKDGFKITSNDIELDLDASGKTFKITTSSMELNLDGNSNMLKVGKSAAEPLVTMTQLNQVIADLNAFKTVFATYTTAMATWEALVLAALPTATPVVPAVTVPPLAPTTGTLSIKVKD
jgi:phage gp45-like